MAEVVASHPLRADSIILSGDKTRDLPGPADLSDWRPSFLQESTTTDWPGYSVHVSEASEEKGKTPGIGRTIEIWDQAFRAK